MTVQTTADLRDKIREAVLHAECERPQKCPDCITDSVLAVVAADVERSARDAAQCARNTDAAAGIIREALQTGHQVGADLGLRHLYALAADVDGLLDGLGLPDLNPWPPVALPAPEVDAADEFVNELLEHAPRCWDGDVAAESIALDYLRHLENPARTSAHRPHCDGDC
ncbi:MULTISPECIES: hypothetical protein [Streptosporangiaceae]|uniref:hypothetical protein n=1 Tax=Streptosporangiaceae TaxID=2004 RepID=UPI0033E3CE4D